LGVAPETVAGLSEAPLRSGTSDQASPIPNAPSHEDRVRALADLITDDDVQWVVNDIAELGVKIGNRFFFMYKGGSLEYRDGINSDDGEPMMWREIGKREFGECCKPVKMVLGELRLNGEKYREPMFTWKKDFDGMEELPNGGWSELPRIDDAKATTPNT
jgi:hypothetical protein